MTRRKPGSRRRKVPPFDTRRLPRDRDAVAPDGADVRILLARPGGSMAHFALASRHTSTAVAHRTVEEIWFFLSGRGHMWRKQGAREDVTRVEPGLCITIPLGTHFQFRCSSREPLAAVAVTMPPWPGDREAYVVRGRWLPTVLEPRGVSIPRRTTAGAGST